MTWAINTRQEEIIVQLTTQFISTYSAEFCECKSHIEIKKEFPNNNYIFTITIYFFQITITITIYKYNYNYDLQLRFTITIYNCNLQLQVTITTYENLNSW